MGADRPALPSPTRPAGSVGSAPAPSSFHLAPRRGCRETKQCLDSASSFEPLGGTEAPGGAQDDGQAPTKICLACCPRWPPLAQKSSYFERMGAKAAELIIYYQMGSGSCSPAPANGAEKAESETQNTPLARSPAPLRTPSGQHLNEGGVREAQGVGQGGRGPKCTRRAARKPSKPGEGSRAEKRAGQQSQQQSAGIPDTLEVQGMRTGECSTGGLRQLPLRRRQKLL